VSKKTVPSWTAPQLSLPQTTPDDVRLGQLLGEDLSKNAVPQVVLVGFPSDEGVRRNGGRPGAAQAPDALRHFLYKLTPDPERVEPFRRLLQHTRDLGNLVLSGELERDQALLGSAIAPYLNRGVVVIVLGGGHETAYGHFLGYVEADQEVALLNLDAHADVRPLNVGKGHSGSPFRQALDHPLKFCLGYTVAGLLPHAVSQSHLDFIAEHGGRFVWRSALTRQAIDEVFASLDQAHLVTFDLDAVDQAYAPGVSAPATRGLSSELWLYAAYKAGKQPQVRSFDVVELNPTYDRDGQTARLAALTVWQFLRGLVDRRSAG